MAEYSTCFDGCVCSECRQRRTDYFLVKSLISDYEDEIYDDRLSDAMENIGYKKKKDYRR